MEIRNRKGIIIYLVVVAIVGIGAISMALFSVFQRPKVGYIELSTLYDEFELKKELESKLINVQNNRQLILDSLKLQLQTSTASIQDKTNPTNSEISKWQTLKSNYQETEKQFAEDNYSMTETYNQQIWKQLNQYVEDYGKENNYEFIYGAEGSGALMYGNKEYDITQELIKYSNEKYKGI